MFQDLRGRLPGVSYGYQFNVAVDPALIEWRIGRELVPVEFAFDLIYDPVPLLFVPQSEINFMIEMTT